MKAYGYSKKENTNLIELSECTLECTLDELEKLILFFEGYKKDLQNALKKEMWKNDQEIIVHRHYDYTSKNDSVDFIIASRLNCSTD